MASVSHALLAPHTLVSLRGCPSHRRAARVHPTAPTRSSQGLPSAALAHVFSRTSSIFFTSKIKSRRLSIRWSGDASTEVTTEAGDDFTSPVESTESTVEAPKGPPSLISALNVEKALRGIAITDVDHYGRLGIGRGCSYDQVTVAYKNKVEELLLNQGLDKEEDREKMEQLKESFAILSSEEERRLYDWSLGRSENPDKYAWPFETDIAQTSTRNPPPQEPEDEGPTKLLGYFFFVWLLISFILSIAFNR